MLHRSTSTAARGILTSARLDELRLWIFQETAIDTSHQILMTVRGKQVKLQTLQSDPEIFLYDRRLLAGTSTQPNVALVRRPSFTPSTPEAPPQTPRGNASFSEWQETFLQKQKWAAHVADTSRRTVEHVLRLEQERDIIQRGTVIAVDNIKQHLGTLRPKYEESLGWADQICDDQKFLLEHWQDRLEKLALIPGSRDLGRYIRSGQIKGTSKPRSHLEIKLQEFVITQDVQEAGSSGQKLYEDFATRVDELKSAYNDVNSESDRIAEDFQSLTSLSASEIVARADGLMEEVDVLAGKFKADYETIRRLPETPKSLSQASKTAHVHDNTFVHSLTQANEDIRALLRQITELKNDIAKYSLQYLQQISKVESNIQSIHTLLADLDVGSESTRVFELLDFAVRLPAVYGSLLVECIRRHDWSQNAPTSPSPVGEENALPKSEENKRRQRWAKEMTSAVNVHAFDEGTSRLDINWPDVTKNDIKAFIAQLESLGGFSDTVKELKELAKSLDTPARQQTGRPSVFKNGSIHEAAYSKGSLLPRADDETMISIRKDRTRAEEKLKSAESRIRKLEDLLHRQSQYPRPLNATGLGVSTNPTFERQTSSPVTNFTSALSKAREPDPRRHNTSTRRISFNHDTDDKTLAQRIVSLEAELIAQKAQSKNLEKTSSARTNAEEMLKEQARDAIRTKEDLLSNFEAQQHEFDHDRRIFADETKKLKIRIEELEDELDHVCQSQEHEFKIQALTEELESTRRDAAGEVQQAHKDTNDVRQAYLTQRDNVNRMERELRRLAEEKSQFQSQADERLVDIRARDQALTIHHQALRATLSHVSKETPPEEFSTLVAMVEAEVEGFASRQNNLQASHEGLKGNNQALDVRIQSQTKKLDELREHLRGEESKVLLIGEELKQTNTQRATLQSQLDMTRQQQQQLESQMAAGSSDAESLKTRLGGEEQKNSDLLAKIQDMEGMIQNMQSHLEEKRSELASLEGSYVRLNSTRDAQAERALDVSTRLLIQNVTVQHLLEQVGFSVTKRNNSTVIQRISSRTSSGSTTLNDPSMSMKRSISGPLPTNNDLEALMDPKVLHWAKAEDPEQAAQLYADYTAQAVSFEMDAFCETIYKRIKEIEHIARKAQRDARAYRDKAHRAQSEAHDRLALRSFKEGDLALFLPTRDQATKPWAAFNVGAPHYFLREHDSHKLGKRDWLIARISKVEERVVDLAKSMNGLKLNEQRASLEGGSGGALVDDENPYELSDGLRWYLLDAAEEKPGAPINVGLGKSTVASVNVDATGSIPMKKASDNNGATRTLTRSLDSRRSSTNSKRGLVAIASNSAGLEGTIEALKSPALAGEGSSIDAEDSKRPQSSRTLDIPQTGENRSEHVGTPPIPSPPDWSH